MRATSILRGLLVLAVLGSISVAGTAIVWSTGERILSAATVNTPLTDADHPIVPQAEDIQPVQAQDIEKQLRNYRVRLRRDGRLPGRINIVDPETGEISPARDLQIALLQNGTVVTEFRPGINGLFEAEGVLPGVYSLVGHGEEGYIAYGLEVLPPEFRVDHRLDAHQVAFQEIEEALEIDSLAVPPTDGPSVLSLATEHLPQDIVARAAEIAAAAGDAPPQPPEVAPDVDEQIELDEVEDSPADETVPSANLRQHDVRLAADGSLTGRMRSLNPQSGQPVRFRRLNVFLVKNNEIVAQAPVTPLGVFTFPDLAPGQYSFVAAGTEGFAAFSIRTVSEDVAGPGAPDEFVVPVAFAQADPFGLFGTLTSLEDFYYLYYWLRYYYGEDDDDGALGALFGDGGPPGFGGGGGGGGFGGGSAGGGGFGGFGGDSIAPWLALGAFGILAAIIASEDNGRSRRVVSPAILQ